MTETKNDLCTLEEWLHDLETTDAKKTTGRLRRLDDDGFCCLGRLCEISDSATRSWYGYSIETQTWETSVPEQSWMSSDQQSACVSANDSLGWSFKQIALWWRETGGAWKEDESPRKEGDMRNVIPVPDFVQPGEPA